MKYTILFTLIGFCYVLIEALYRSVVDISSISMTQSLVALVMGGLSGIMIGLLNEKFPMKMIIQSLIGLVIILTVEYFAGVTFNADYSIWDYRHLPFNIDGQISLPFGIAWFAMTPFVSWLDDHFRHNVLKEESNQTMLQYYLRWFKWE